jgi:SAM-dependent methyltransferase
LEDHHVARYALVEGSNMSSENSASFPDAVRELYEAFPFPGSQHYADSASEIVAELRRLQVLSGSWLDLGCGTGELLLGFARAVPEMNFIGVDFSAASLSMARALPMSTELTNVVFDHADILDPKWGHGGYDVVSAMGSLHHLQDPADGFRQAARALKPGGLFVFHYYGAHGRYARKLDQEMVRLIASNAFTLHEGIDIARKLFQPKILLNGDAMPEQWIADQYVHPRERAFRADELYDLLKELHIDWLYWMWVAQTPAELISDEGLRERVRTLPERSRLLLLDLLLRREHNVWIGRKR